jgi:potassium efflux system protein
VLFLTFGDSSLDFELRVWILDVDARLQVKSDLYHKLECKFRELNVVVPFPQRDVNFPGFDGPNTLLTQPKSG